MSDHHSSSSGRRRSRQRAESIGTTSRAASDPIATGRTQSEIKPPIGALPSPNSEEPSPRLALRPREAARALGISPRSLWSLTKDGEIPHARVGRTVLYPVDLLRDWLADQARKEER